MIPKFPTQQLSAWSNPQVRASCGHAQALTDSLCACICAHAPAREHAHVWVWLCVSGGVVGLHSALPPLCVGVCAHCMDVDIVNYDKI
jgi:hypothetical protein